MEKLFQLTENEVNNLSSKFGTPLLVVSNKQVEQNYKFFQKNLPNVKVYYAIKSNPNIEIIKKLEQLGSNFDVASKGEILYLHELGINSSRMIYANPTKPIESIKIAKEVGIKKFTFDTKSELDKFAEYYNEAELIMRIKVNKTDAKVNLNEKFGVETTSVMDLFEYAKELNLNIVGLSFHVGSQSMNANAYVETLKMCKDISNKVSTLGFTIKYIDIGGGFPSLDSCDELALQDIMNTISQSLSEYCPDCEFWAEPGRYMCNNTINLITSVIGKSTRNNQQWYHLDEGLYGTFSGITFDYRNYEMVTFSNGDKQQATLTGPSCDSIDVICRDIEIDTLNVGDKILVLNCGAYSGVTATTFNGFEKAPTILYEK